MDRSSPLGGSATGPGAGGAGAASRWRCGTTPGPSVWTAGGWGASPGPGGPGSRRKRGWGRAGTEPERHTSEAPPPREPGPLAAGVTRFQQGPRLCSLIPPRVLPRDRNGRGCRGIESQRPPRSHTAGTPPHTSSGSWRAMPSCQSGSRTVPRWHFCSPTGPCTKFLAAQRGHSAASLEGARTSALRALEAQTPGAAPTRPRHLGPGTHHTQVLGWLPSPQSMAVHLVLSRLLCTVG